MSRADNIRARLRDVVGGNSSKTLGETWQYRRITSAYGISPRTYGAYNDVTGLATGRSFQENYDQDMHVYRRVEAQLFRCADNDPDPALRMGDQVQDREGLIWDVYGQPRRAYGTIAYTLQREVPLLADADRQGGV